VVERLDWTAEPAGSLRVVSEPADARVLVDGEELGRTPLMLDEVSVGPHTIVIESTAGTVRQNVTIVVDQLTVVDELIFDGWVAPVSPFDIQISENGRTLRPDDRGQIALSPGSHRLRIQNVAFGYDATHTVDITPANTTRLDIVPPPTSIRVTASEPADVFIDGTRVGSTPLNTSLALGTREVVVRTAAGDERREFVTATVAPVEYHADFSQR
jgi:hypothetical protein